MQTGVQPAKWLARPRGRSRAAAGKIATAFDRVELISDALTAIVAAKAGYTVITEDADFDVFDFRSFRDFKFSFTTSERHSDDEKFREACG